MRFAARPLDVFITMHNYGHMDTTELIAAGENLEVEFKRTINDRELVEAAACLANANGGTLLIGIDEPSTVVGAASRHGDHTDPVRVATFIQNNTEPALPVIVTVEHHGGLDVIRVDVPRSDPWPVATKKGLYTKRVLDSHGRPQCVPMTPHEIVSGGMMTRGMDYAQSPAVGAVASDLDPLEFDRFRLLCTQGGDEAIGKLSDADILRALGLVDMRQQVTIGAILLFGTTSSIQRWAPSAEVLFQDLRAGEPQVNERFLGPLLKAAEWVSERIDDRQSSTELISGMFRIEVPLIPVRTRRESVANALVHRDYSALGPTVVQLTDTEFSVSNPGGLPPGVTIVNLLKQSRPRSPIIADAFKRAGLVDRRGKGVNDMFEQQLRAGRDVPDYSRTTSDSVTVQVPLGVANIELVRFLLQFENDTSQALGIDELRLVHEVHIQGSATASGLSDSLTIAPQIVRIAAGRLVEQGILESRGQGRGRKYHLTARFYDLAEDRAAYVRIKGADPVQQERMILDYVDTFGSITRSEAAQLCQTAPTQARNVLKRLVGTDRLALIGERRGARYVSPRIGDGHQ